MEVRVEDSFEVLSQEEWDKYLGTDIFDNMFFEAGTLGESGDILQNITRPRLHELIQEHNNKVGSLRITYADTTMTKESRMTRGIYHPAKKDNRYSIFRTSMKNTG